MKLFFDQNLSFKLVAKLKDLFPESTQAKLEGLETATDHQIWDFALKNGCVIVSLDSDFEDISILKGHPPKLILCDVEIVPQRKLNLCLEIIFQPLKSL